MNSKINKIVSFCILLILVVNILVPKIIFANNFEIEDEEMFIDENLQKYIKENYGENLDLENITNLDLSNLDIKDISGIENITNLEKLNLSGNYIKYIDVSSLEKLKNITIEYSEDVDFRVSENYGIELGDINTLLNVEYTQIESIKNNFEGIKENIESKSNSSLKVRTDGIDLYELSKIQISYESKDTKNIINTNISVNYKDNENKNIEDEEIIKNLKIPDEKYIFMEQEKINENIEDILYKYLSQNIEDEEIQIYFELNENDIITNTLNKYIPSLTIYIHKEGIVYNIRQIDEKIFVPVINMEEVNEENIQNKIKEIYNIEDDFSIKSGAFDSSENEIEEITNAFTIYIEDKNIGFIQILEYINIEDENLEKVILSQVDSNNDNKISKSEALNIKILEAESQNISSLKGIENLKNLEVIYLQYNNLKNIDEIEKLTNLSLLNLYGNENLSGKLDLSNLEKLTELAIKTNKNLEIILSDNFGLDKEFQQILKIEQTHYEAINSNFEKIYDKIDELNNNSEYEIKYSSIRNLDNLEYITLSYIKDKFEIVCSTYIEYLSEKNDEDEQYIQNLKFLDNNEIIIEKEDFLFKNDENLKELIYEKILENINDDNIQIILNGDIKRDDINIYFENVEVYIFKNEVFYEIRDLENIIFIPVIEVSNINLEDNIKEETLQINDGLNINEITLEIERIENEIKCIIYENEMKIGCIYLNILNDEFIFENSYMYGITENTKTINVIKSLKNIFDNVIIYNINDEILLNDDLIGSGSKIYFSNNEEEFEYTVIIKGDVNGDGFVDAEDALMVLSKFVGKIEFEEYQKQAALLKNNIDIETAYRILHYSVGNIENLI